jgi:large subunit ribosomal protein L19
MSDISGIKFSPVNIEERKKLDIRSGDIIKVWQKIKEGDKIRHQHFEGIVIARKHGKEPGASFTVRKTAGGVGVELTFPLYSPTIEKIELISRPKRVRRAKLYYIREKAAKTIRKKMKQTERFEETIIKTSSEDQNEKEKEKKEKAKKTENEKELESDKG